MALELNGTTGVSLVQDGVVTAADLASGAITAAALPAGSVIQVVSEYTADQATLTSSSFGDFLTATITPSSTSNQIAVFCYTNTYAASANILEMTVFRGLASGGVNLGTGAYSYIAQHGGNADMRSNCGLYLVDSPGTTSAQTYSFAGRRNGSGSVVMGNNGARSTIILMEIAA